MGKFIEYCVLAGSILVILCYGIRVGKKLASIHRAIKDDHEKARNVYNKTMGESAVDIASGIYGYSERVEFDIKEMDPIRKDYNEHSTEYISWAQKISLFPLFGLLGTVGGIIPGLWQVRNAEFELLYESLSIALLTTFAGLIITISLKLLSSEHGKTMNDIENYFEENDRKYSQALGIGNVTDKSKIE